MLNHRPSASRWTGSSGTPSQYGSTARDLNHRRVTAVETPYVPYFHSQDSRVEAARAVRAFVSELLLSPRDVTLLKENELDKSCDKLLSVLSRVYRGETPFNVALFKAMGECLRRFAVSPNTRRRRLTPWGRVLVTKTKIILTHVNGHTAGDEYEYAAGLVRKAILPADRGCILESDARIDHAWVMYRRPAGNQRSDWAVWRALAVVDFKWGYSNWEIPRSDGEGGNVDAENLVLSRNTNVPLAQVVMYALAHVAPGIASLGELPPSIPYAVVQCRTNTSKVDVGWVHGNLLTPETCGELYIFNVDAYGSIYPQKESNGPSLAAYLDVMTKGLQVARRWLQSLPWPPTPGPRPPLQRQQWALPAPHQLSGRILRFGRRFDTPDRTEIRNATLLATPVLGYCADATGLYRVHQGEIFRASVDLNRLRSDLADQDQKYVYWCLDAYPNPSAVLIKVNSLACFNLLIPSQSAFLYNVDRWDQMAEVRMALSSSLHGFYLTPDDCGLVQLLPDLRSLGYASLPDGSGLDAAGWGALWKAFAALVRQVLLPLARAGIVHSDIRTGYDGTANLLYNKESGSMRLIDLDSLCMFRVFNRSTDVTDPRHLSPHTLPAPLKHARAMGFVLGQVLCAAEVWLGAIPHRDVNAKAMVRLALQRRPPAARASGADDRSLDTNRSVDAGSGGGSVFDSSAFDTAGNFNAVVDEGLIKTALKRYQAKFEQVPSSVAGA